MLGAKKVKDPDPSISGLSLEMSAYFWVEVAFTRPKVPYTWSIGATKKEIYNKHYKMSACLSENRNKKSLKHLGVEKKDSTCVDSMLQHPLLVYLV